MPRTADFTIQGYLYQFDKTLLEILRADNSTKIILEGPIEDIDVEFPDGSIQAMQCKYHEAKEFVPSAIYKPLLQMLHHYVASGTDVDTRYTLFVHFSDRSDCKRNIEMSELEGALGSSDHSLQSLIQTIRKVREDIALDDFQERCTLEFGPSRGDLYSQIVNDCKRNGLPEDSIETLFYPNAINEIANRSTYHSADERTVTKSEFLGKLKEIRKTAISKWTLALNNRKKLLQTKRKQLKPNLSKNTRDRCLIISEEIIEGFANDIISFVQDFLDKYHFKVNHEKPPTLYLDCEISTFEHICERLFRKGIISTDGMIPGTGTFDESRFFRAPVLRMRTKSDFTADFRIRITCHCFGRNVLQDHSFDDVFIVSARQDTFLLRQQDIEIEHLPLSTFRELKYVLGMLDDFE